MAKIRVTKEFSFEAAHALLGYDGACRHIHGHSYKLFVTVIGEPLDDKNSPKDGMVVDFSLLKKIVKSEIIDIFDHAMVMDSRSPKDENLEQKYGNVVMMPQRPTCENMVAHFAQKIMDHLPTGIVLHHLKLHETATSYAQWYREDNL